MPGLNVRAEGGVGSVDRELVLDGIPIRGVTLFRLPTNYFVISETNEIIA